MERILITGPVTSGHKEQIELYRRMVEICSKYAKEVHSPLDTMAFTGSVQERYKRAMQLVSSAGLLVGEMTVPSTGQGMEIQKACEKNIPIVIVARKGARVSSVVLGCPALRRVLYYESLDDLSSVLESSLQNSVENAG